MTIDLNLNEEQAQIVASLRDMLADRFPASRLLARRDGANDEGETLRAIAEFGGLSLSRPEAAGGAGLSIVEEALLHVELGRFLVTPCALAAAIGARLADKAGLSAIGADIASGTSRICLASAARAGDAIDGEDAYLLDWRGCDLVLLWRGELFILLDARRLSIREAQAMDRAVGLGRAAIDQSAALATTTSPELAAAADLLASAQLLGVAEATRDLAADYAKIRRQFGAPIGSFQAVKHRCANMAVHAELLSAQLAFAAIAARDGWADASFQTAACRLLANRWALENAAGAVQVHGGVGFSAELSVHLYVLRAHLLETLGGPIERLEERLTAYRNPDLVRDGAEA